MRPKCECGADQVPGRTITESEFQEVVRSHKSIRDLVKMLGITVTPDPEPTNAEKWVKFCSSKMGLDLDPWQANVLDKAGVKAPTDD